MAPRIKHLIFIMALVPFWSFAQDTLIDKKGNQRIGKILSVDELSNLLTLQTEQGTVVFKLSELKYVSNREVKNPKEGTLPNATPVYTTHFHGTRSNYIPPKYTYSPYSVGWNIIPLLNFLPKDSENGRYASNRTLELFAQREINDKFAIRIPLRIGLNPISKEMISGDYGIYSKEIIGDIGVEPLFNLNGFKQLTWIFAPQFSFGRARAAYIKSPDSLAGPVYNYLPMGDYSYIRAGFSTGLQLNVTRTIQFGLELSAYLANNFMPSYYVNAYSYGYQRLYGGIGFRGFLSYRFGGRLKE